MLAQLINRTLKPLGLKISLIQEKVVTKPGNRYNLTEKTPEDFSLKTKKSLNLLNYTKGSGSSYNAKLYVSGYHSIELDGQQFHGQRNPGDRLKDIPLNFTDKVVLDIGCNQGGMLREISHTIKKGIGIDYDYRMINAANHIASHKKLTNLHYYVFDLENENLDVIDNYLPEKVDIVFLLSICMWINNWEAVIEKISAITDDLLFESNGTPEQQSEQLTKLKKTFKNVELLRSSSPDDPKQKERKLYLCNN
ncbi:MAG: class I SAM-dependent methyltransferase [Methylococcales bacterium]